MLRLFRAFALTLALLGAVAPLWAQATTSVLVQIEKPDLPTGSENLSFDVVIDPNGAAPAETVRVIFLVKSSMANYVAAIRSVVKARILANEGVTLQNSDVIIWPILQ